MSRPSQGSLAGWPLTLGRVLMGGLADGQSVRSRNASVIRVIRVIGSRILLLCFQCLDPWFLSDLTRSHWHRCDRCDRSLERNKCHAGAG